MVHAFPHPTGTSQGHIEGILETLLLGKQPRGNLRTSWGQLPIFCSCAGCLILAAVFWLDHNVYTFRNYDPANHARRCIQDNLLLNCLLPFQVPWRTLLDVKTWFAWLQANPIRLTAVAMAMKCYEAIPSWSWSNLTLHFLNKDIGLRVF